MMEKVILLLSYSGQTVLQLVADEHETTYAGVKALTNGWNYVAVVPTNEMNIIMKSKMAKLNDDQAEEEEDES